MREMISLGRNEVVGSAAVSTSTTYWKMSMRVSVGRCRIGDLSAFLADLSDLAPFDNVEDVPCSGEDWELPIRTGVKVRVGMPSADPGPFWRLLGVI